MFALAITLSLALPAFVSGELTFANSQVKTLDVKGFKEALKPNATSVVSFMSEKCPTCDRISMELSKAALGLYPHIPVYAVDCEDGKSKQLCIEQGAFELPTVKLFQRGLSMSPRPYDYEQEMSGSSLFYWAERNVPHENRKFYHIDDIKSWVVDAEEGRRPRVLLLTRAKTVPLVWQVVANKYRDDFKFASHRDRKGRSSVAMGFEAGGDKDSKILYYPPGSTTPVRFEGILKTDQISRFLDSILDGTADLSAVNAEALAAAEEYEPSEEEEEIMRQQEMQRIALAHGGFEDLIDFEEAIKQYGTNFHGAHGAGAHMLGEMPKKKKASESAEVKKEKKEDPIHRILKAQAEREARLRTEKPSPMPNTANPVAAETSSVDSATEFVGATPTPASVKSAPEPADIGSAPKHEEL
ncbi:hypothetical protein PENSPDRAFT_685102 [Peniophora sp. CONT]|nr:hypothetical protein PENSPDRAFT_685102 [Peniophora sp. CONT]